MKTEQLTTFPQAIELARPAAGIFRDDADLLEAARALLRAPGARGVVIYESGDFRGFVSETKLMKGVLMAMTSGKHGMRLRDMPDLLEPGLVIAPETAFPEVMKLIVKSPRGLLVQGARRQMLGVIGVRDALQTLMRESPSQQTEAHTLSEAQSRVESEVRSETNLAEALLLYQGLFESSPYMIHSLDAGGKVLLGNRAFHETLGYAPGALHGKSFKEIYAERHWPAAERGLRTIMEKGSFEATKTSMRHRDGSLVPVEVRSSALKDLRENFVGTISVVRRMDLDPEVHSIMELIGIFDESKNPQT